MTTQFAAPAVHGFEWIDLTNPSVEELRAIAAQYGLHEELVEDCLEPEHLPKFELINDAVFIIARIYDSKAKSDAATIQELTRKIAIFHSRNFLITIHRTEQPFLTDLKNKSVDTMKCSGGFEMLCKILQVVFLSYEEPALKLADELDFFESKILLGNKSSHVYIKSLYQIKIKASISRRIINLSKSITDKIDENRQRGPLIQELHDDYLHVETLYDELIEGVNNLLNIYISLSSQKTNEVMRVLTIFSVFFMPLTFIVGVYGMNFRYMPELDSRIGYPMVWGAMAAVTLVVYIWFRRKKWL